jgi:membrane associated rhomboid family serine protease
MNPGDEAVPPPPAPAPAPPTPEDVLRWVAAGGTEPWFASAHARATGTPRDNLDAPINSLLQAGLIRAATWVRGAGQGFALTPAGAELLRDAAASAAFYGRDPPAPAPGPAPPPGPALDRRPAVVTAVLLAANVLWFVAGLVVALRLGVGLSDYALGRSPVVLARTGAVTGTDLLAGQWWRLATACFVHVGVLHLFVNMLNLGLMGPVAELLWGRWRLPVIYAAAGLAGGCLAMAARPAGLLAGASGALWGVQTALLAWVLIYRDRLAPAVAADLFRRLGVAFALGVAVSLVPGVSWEAHLGGGLGGFAAAGLLHALRVGDRPRRAAAAALLVLLPWVCVCGLLVAMKSGSTWKTLRERAAAAREAEEAARRQAEVAKQVDAFNREAGPRLAAVQPAAMKPVNLAAVRAWALPADRRPAAVAEVRAAVERLRQTAAEAEAAATGPASGDERFDRLREQVRLAAAARVRELDVLLKLLDPAAPPDPAGWRAWADARRDADRLFNELPVR